MCLALFACTDRSMWLIDLSLWNILHQQQMNYRLGPPEDKNKFCSLLLVDLVADPHFNLIRD